MTPTAAVSRREDLELRAGECALLARLLVSPPDASVLSDAEAAGLMDGGWNERVEEVQVEFTRLFSAPGPDRIASHQSEYTDTLQLEPSGPDPSGCGMAFPGGAFQGYLGGRSMQEAAHFYRAVHFHSSGECPPMADHVSAQLEFLSYLLRAEALSPGPEEARDWRDLRREFTDRFLGRWLGDFARKLSANPVSALYRRVGTRLGELCITITEKSGAGADEALTRR